MTTQIEHWTKADGRHAEMRTTENDQGNGFSEKVVEHLLQDEIPLRLTHRVTEKQKPFIYERKTEMVDKDGNVVEQKVESVEPNVPMQKVQHIVSEGVHAQYLTKQEMVDTIVAAMQASKVTRTGAVDPDLLSDIKNKVEQSTPKDRLYAAVIIGLVLAIAYVVFLM